MWNLIKLLPYIFGGSIVGAVWFGWSTYQSNIDELDSLKSQIIQRDVALAERDSEIGLLKWRTAESEIISAERRERAEIYRDDDQKHRSEIDSLKSTIAKLTNTDKAELSDSEMAYLNCAFVSPPVNTFRVRDNTSATSKGGS